jgi:hypothetical protein
MRHRIGTIFPQGEVVVSTIHHLLDNLSPRKKMMAFVVAGVVGLVLFLLLLEISVRKELAAEARDVAIDAAASASSASVEKMPFEDRFAINRAPLCCSLWTHQMH